jgi:hypothetical protein
LEFVDNDTIFMQGQPADSLYFVLRGKVRLGVAARDGKEAIVATLGDGEFFGEGCLAGQSLRMATATSAGECTLAQVNKPMMVRLLRDEPGLAEVFVRIWSPALYSLKRISSTRCSIPAASGANALRCRTSVQAKPKLAAPGPIRPPWRRWWRPDRGSTCSEQFRSWFIGLQRSRADGPSRASARLRD